MKKLSFVIFCILLVTLTCLFMLTSCGDTSSDISGDISGDTSSDAVITDNTGAGNTDSTGDVGEIGNMDIEPKASVKINGASIDTYTIAYASSELSHSFATALADVIAERTDATLSTVAIANASGNVIVVEEAENFVSNDDTYGIFVDGNTLKITYTSGSTAYSALKAFKEMLHGEVDFADGYSLTKEADVLRVTMLGDSNTRNGKVLQWLDTYLVTRFPDKIIDVENRGIGGDTTEDAIRRLEWDVYPSDPDIVIISFGINDVNNYFSDANGRIVIGKRTQRIQWFISNLETLIGNLTERGIEVVLASSISYDEWVKSSEENRIGINEGFDLLTAKIKALAEKHSLEFVDYHSNISLVIKDYRELTNTDGQTIFNDRKHVNEAGALAAVFAYAEDHSEWGSDCVASLSLNVTDKTYKFENAKFLLKEASSTKVVFDYKPLSLPLPANSYYKKLDSYGMLPLSDYNDEIIKITGLEAGEYTISFGGVVITTATAEELANGVNIATLDKNPSQKAAIEIYNLLAEKNQNETTMRADAYVEEKFLQKNGIVLNSVEEKLAYYQQCIADGSATGNTKSSMESYIKNADKFDTYIDQMENSYFCAHVLADVDAYQVTITKK